MQLLTTIAMYSLWMESPMRSVMCVISIYLLRRHCWLLITMTDAVLLTSVQPPEERPVPGDTQHTATDHITHICSAQNNDTISTYRDIDARLFTGNHLSNLV